MSSHISQYRDCWSLILNTDTDLERKDDGPFNDELATQEIAEETTTAPVYQRIVDSIELDKQLLADLQTNVARQKQIESSMKQIIAVEQKVAPALQAAMASEQKFISEMEGNETLMEILASRGEHVGSSGEIRAGLKEMFANGMEHFAAWKKCLASIKEQLVLGKRELGGELYEASLKQANIAKAILDLGEDNELKEEH